MTTLQKDHLEAFRSDVERFGRTLESFAQMLHLPEDNNIMMDEIPDSYQDTPITEKQKNLLVDLIHQKYSSKEERERWLTEIETCSKFDASEMISSLLMGAR